MHCYHCAALANSGEAFCGHCGARLGFEEAVRAALAREESAVTYLYNETYNSVFRAIRPLIRDEDTALDILQDTYIKAFESLEQLENPEQFRAWVKRIAQNKSKDWLKKKKPTLFSEMRPDDDSGEVDFLDDREFTQPDVTLDKEETRRLLWEIIDSLSDEQRLVVSMYYFQEMQVKEIALDLGVSENTVKSRLNYARKNIESKVLHLEKQGTKLYSLAPLPFLLWLIRSGMEVPSTAALAEITGAVGASGAAAAVASAGGTAGTAAGATTTAASGAAAGAAAAGTALAVKIVAGIVAAAVAIGGGVALYKTLSPDDEQGTIDNAFEEEQDSADESPEPELTLEPEQEDEPEPEIDLEGLNAERIAAYASIAEQMGSGFDDSNRFLLYDCDGDGLDELLAATFDTTGVTADIFTVDESGDPVSVFSYEGNGVRVTGNFFAQLTLGEDDYLAYSIAEVSGGTGVIYGIYFLLDETDGDFEVVHEVTWIDFVNEDAKNAYEQWSNTEPYYTLDGEEMDADAFEALKDNAVFLFDDSLNCSGFVDTYKAPGAAAVTTPDTKIDYVGYSYSGGNITYRIEEVGESVRVAYIVQTDEGEVTIAYTISGTWTENTLIMESVHVDESDMTWQFDDFDFVFHEDMIELTLKTEETAPDPARRDATYILTK